MAKSSTSNGLVTPRNHQPVPAQGPAFNTSETVELADLYFFHPLGLICARIANSLRMTPTQVTVLSALIGITGGVLLFAERLGLLAFGLLIVHSIIDSADGQLARMTGRSTELGKVLDGCSGYVTHASIYLAIAGGVLHRGGGSLILLWMLLAGIATIAHAQMYDYHRTDYTSIVGKGEVPRRESANVAPSLRLLYGGYLFMQRSIIDLHGGVETALARRSVEGVVRDEDRVRYRHHFYWPVRGWNLLGDNTRFYAVGVLACFHRVDLYFAFILFFMNFAFVALWLWQRRADQRFLASLQ